MQNWGNGGEKLWFISMVFFSLENQNYLLQGLQKFWHDWKFQTGHYHGMILSTRRESALFGQWTMNIFKLIIHSAGKYSSNCKWLVLKPADVLSYGSMKILVFANTELSWVVEIWNQHCSITWWEKDWELPIANLPWMFFFFLCVCRLHCAHVEWRKYIQHLSKESEPRTEH